MRSPHASVITHRGLGMPLLQPYPLQQPREKGEVIAIPPMPRRVASFTARKTRHNFVVECLPRPKGLFKPQPYLYTCARCKQSFRVNDTRNSIIPLDTKGTPLPDNE